MHAHVQKYVHLHTQDAHTVTQCTCVYTISQCMQKYTHICVHPYQFTHMYVPLTHVYSHTTYMQAHVLAHRAQAPVSDPDPQEPPVLYCQVGSPLSAPHCTREYVHTPVPPGSDTATGAHLLSCRAIHAVPRQDLPSFLTPGS